MQPCRLSSTNAEPKKIFLRHECHPNRLKCSIYCTACIRRTWISGRITFEMRLVTMKHIPKSAQKKACADFIVVRLEIVRRTLTDALPIIHWFSSYTLHIRAVRFVYSFSYCSNIGLRWNGKICDVFERSFSKKYFHTGYNCYSFILFLDTDFEHNWMRQFMYLNHQ